jgi:hypothetical protein
MNDHILPFEYQNTLIEGRTGASGLPPASLLLFAHRLNSCYPMTLNGCCWDIVMIVVVLNK